LATGRGTPTHNDIPMQRVRLQSWTSKLHNHNMYKYNCFNKNKAIFLFLSTALLPGVFAIIEHLLFCDFGH
jgi:hypothetical protein